MTGLVKANVIFFDNRETSPDPWTKEVWYYDYRTNIHHTLKKKPMRYEHLSEFIECYNPRNRHRRKATWDEQEAPEGRWRSYGYEELTAPASMSSGSRTRAWSTWITCRNRTSSPSRLSRTWKLGLMAFARCLRRCGSRCSP